MSDFPRAHVDGETVDGAYVTDLEERAASFAIEQAAAYSATSVAGFGLAACAAVATSNVALSGLQTIDGYTLTNNDRVLLIGQSTGSQNGPWVAHSGAWVRPTDYVAGQVVTGSRSVLILNGAANQYATIVLRTSPATVDTTATSWSSGLPGAVVTVSSPAGQSNKPPDIWAPAPSGDVTGATDSAAVQALIDNLSAAGGGRVLLRAGTYWGNLTLKPYVIVQGRGGWGGKTTWKAPTTLSGQMIAGLNWATLTGKAKATGDYLLGAPGCGLIGMTLDGNAHATNCATIWASYFELDDLVWQNATGVGLITEFTDVDNFADLTQHMDPLVGKVQANGNGGDGWVCRSQSTARWFTSYENGGWGLTVDSKDGSYSGQLCVGWLESFLNGNGIRVGNINNPTSGTASGALRCVGECDSNGSGTGLLLQACTGGSDIDLLMTQWATAVDLNGREHRITVMLDRNTDGIKINGVQKSVITIKGASSNTGAVLRYVSEGGPNVVIGTADIGVGPATFLSNSPTQWNIESIILASANGAGGGFSVTKLPSSTLYSSNGWGPSLPPSNGQLLADGVAGIAYSASMTPDATAAGQQQISVSDGNAMTLNAPTGLRNGQRFDLLILNNSGGAMGAITWNGTYRLAGAFTNPANGKGRTISFMYSSGYLWELGRSTADL